jgi:hypothetical protein
VEIAAIPTFISPFDWRIVAQMSNAYEIHDLNVLDNRFRRPDSETGVFWRQVTRYPNSWTPAVQQAAATRLGRVFLGFSRFPAARNVSDAAGNTTVRFSDVRFAIGPFLTDQQGREVHPFTATIRLDAREHVITETLGR